MEVRNHCYLTRKNGGVYIECPYDPDFLEVLKSAVPSSDRKYDPGTKQWWVSDKYRAQAERDYRTFFENVIEC